MTAEEPLPSGEHQVRLEFSYDGGGIGKGGTAGLYVDGDEVASTRIKRTHSIMFTFDETTDVGRDTGSPVTDEYPTGAANAFTGTIRLFFTSFDGGANWIDGQIPMRSGNGAGDPAPAFCSRRRPMEPAGLEPATS